MVMPGELVFKLILGPTNCTDISADLSDLFEGDSIDTLALPKNLFNTVVYVLVNRIMNDEMPATRNRTHCDQILRGMKYTYGKKRRLAATAGSANNFLAFVKNALANAKPNEGNYIDVYVRSHYSELVIPPGWKGHSFDYLGTDRYPALLQEDTKNDKKAAAASEIKKVAEELERNTDTVAKELAVLTSASSSKAEKEKAVKWLRHLPTYLGGTAKYLKQHMTILDPPTAARPPPREPPNKKPKRALMEVNLPTPASGSQYSRQEVFVYLASLKNAKVRSAALTEIMELDLVPVKTRGSLTNTLKQFESGEISLCDLDKPWGQGSGQAILGMASMASLCKVFEDNPSLPLNKEEVRKQVAKRRREEFEAKGYIPPEDCSPSDTTIRNLMSMLASQRGAKASGGYSELTQQFIHNKSSPAEPLARPLGPLRPLPPKKPKPDIAADLPTPASGSQYSRREVLEFLITLKDPKVRSATITKIFEQKLIPLKNRGHFGHTLKQFEAGELSSDDIDGPWGLGPMTKYKAQRSKNQLETKRLCRKKAPAYDSTMGSDNEKIGSRP